MEKGRRSGSDEARRCKTPAVRKPRLLKDKGAARLRIRGATGSAAGHLCGRRRSRRPRSPIRARALLPLAVEWLHGPVTLDERTGAFPRFSILPFAGVHSSFIAHAPHSTRVLPPPAPFLFLLRFRRTTFSQLLFPREQHRDTRIADADASPSPAPPHPLSLTPSDWFFIAAAPHLRKPLTHPSSAPHRSSTPPVSRR